MYTKDKKSAIHVRISEQDYIDLSKLAEKYNVSVSILCRNIIRAHLSKGTTNANIKTN